MAETFVLVHGAWHGAWCWAAVVNQLEKLGDKAYAVDLPGHGMNQADRSKVTLQNYVDSVAEFIERHQLKDVVLAGHSLGGLTIPGVAAKIPSRIKRVVWVTALVALDGQPIVDPVTSPIAQGADSLPERSISIEMMGKEFVDGLSNDMAPAMKEYVLAAVGPQPIAPMMTPVAMAPYFATGIPSSYIVCEDDQTPVAGAPNWHPYFSSRLNNPTLKFVKSGHEVMFTHPVECAQALHELAHGE
ncbi:alpha/beta fold hydrolase [Candidatus Binatus sp.]|uniref:alpha/beta fold hydrolase n=1 Tax=Candidatus Binatus sp. TaxID=2811406 RepID=UPI003C8BF7B0